MFVKRVKKKTDFFQMWFGVVWCGLVWFEWFGVVWCGLIFWSRGLSGLTFGFVVFLHSSLTWSDLLITTNPTTTVADSRDYSSQCTAESFGKFHRRGRRITKVHISECTHTYMHIHPPTLSICNYSYIVVLGTDSKPELVCAKLE